MMYVIRKRSWRDYSGYSKESSLGDKLIGT